MRNAIALILLALGTAHVAGCGSSGGLSKPQYIARSNAICERTHKQAEDRFKAIVGEEGPPKPGQEQRFITKAQRFLREAAIPTIRENVAERRKLDAPEGDEGKTKAIIAAGERALAGFEQVAGDRSRVRGLFEGKVPDPAQEFDALSRSYGIDKCGGDQ